MGKDDKFKERNIASYKRELRRLQKLSNMNYPK